MRRPLPVLGLLALLLAAWWLWKQDADHADVAPLPTHDDADDIERPILIPGPADEPAPADTGPTDRPPTAMDLVMPDGRLPDSATRDQRSSVRVDVSTWNQSKEGIGVHLIRDGSTSAEAKGVTDKYGQVLMDSIPAGRYEVDLDLPARFEEVWIPYVTFALPGDAPAGRPLDVHVFVVPTETLFLRWDGNADVHWRPRGISADALSKRWGGRSSILIGYRAGERPASGTVFIRKGWQYALLQNVVPTNAFVEVELRYGRWFEGRVEFDEPLGEDERRVGVVVVRSVDHGFTETYGIAADGTFEAMGLPPGTYELGYATQGSRAQGPVVALEAGSPTDGVVLHAK